MTLSAKAKHRVILLVGVIVLLGTAVAITWTTPTPIVGDECNPNDSRVHVTKDGQAVQCKAQLIVAHGQTKRGL